MNDEPKPHRSFMRRWLRRLVIALVALVLVLLLARIVWGYVAARGLRAELAAIRAAGEPVTVDQLEALTPIAEPADDAAPEYAAAFALGLARDDELLALLSACRGVAAAGPGEAPDPVLLEQVADLLDANQTALGLLDTASARNACRYDMGMRGGMQTIVDRTRPVRGLAKLVALRSVSRALAGDGDGAVESMVCGLRLGRVFATQPVLIALLCEVAVVSVAWRDLPAVLERARPSGAALDRLDGACADPDWLTSFPRALIGERVFAISLMTGPGMAGAMSATRPPGQATYHLAFGGWWKRPVREALLAGQLSDMSTFIAASTRPWPEAFDAMQQVEAESMFGKLILPALSAAAGNVGRCASVARSARVALLIERYRRAHGRPPATLDDLMPEITDALPTDPFTGRHLVYRVDDTGYTVYGLGEDRADDGGAIDAPRAKKRKDWGLRVRLGATGP